MTGSPESLSYLYLFLCPLPWFVFLLCFKYLWPRRSVWHVSWAIPLAVDALMALLVYYVMYAEPLEFLKGTNVVLYSGYVAIVLLFLFAVAGTIGTVACLIASIARKPVSLE